ncbi:MAG TPA: UDP-glucose 6-dehydrogenase, partial [Pseudonocardiaceae bacterium]
MDRDPRLTVLGTGYLGLVHAACLAEAGFHVLGVDTDARLIGELNVGRLAIHEPRLAELVRRGLRSGRLSFTTSYRRAAAFGDVHFVCVGTPPRADGSADLSQ